MLASSIKNCFKSVKKIMININKEIFIKALLAGIFSAFTIGVLTVLTYKSALGLFIAGSFGSSMVLLFGFPESHCARPATSCRYLIADAVVAFFRIRDTCHCHCVWTLRQSQGPLD